MLTQDQIAMYCANGCQLVDKLPIKSQARLMQKPPVTIHHRRPGAYAGA